jgi:hypothetical protein
LLEHYLQSLADEGGIVGKTQHDELCAHYNHLAQLTKLVRPEASTLYDAEFPQSANRRQSS